jgi:hypothetical protein
MRRDDMIKFFEHIGLQETTHGIKDAFRFKAVLSSRRKGNMEEVKYHEIAKNTALNLTIANDPAHSDPANSGPALSAQALPLENDDTSVEVPAVPAWTSVFQVDPAPNVINNQANPNVASETNQNQNEPAPATDIPATNIRPRPRGEAKKKSSPNQALSIDSAPAPDRPRPKPRPTGRRKDNPCSPQPELTLDPAFQWDNHVELDP